MGTKFTVYDRGVSPVKAQSLVEKAHTRQELAAVCYVSSAFPLLGSPHFGLGYFGVLFGGYCCWLGTEEGGLNQIMLHCSL